MAMAPTPRSILAGNLRRKREEHGLTQDDLAAAAREWGLDGWTRVTVSEVEQGHRRLVEEELVVLAFVLQAPIRDLLSTDASVVRVGSKELPSGVLYMHEGYLGGVPALGTRGAAVEAVLLERASRLLGESQERIAQAAGECWGHGIAEERELRLARGSGAGDIRVRRGHVTRLLVEELDQKVFAIERMAQAADEAAARLVDDVSAKRYGRGVIEEHERRTAAAKHAGRAPQRAQITRQILSELEEDVVPEWRAAVRKDALARLAQRRKQQIRRPAR